jgi:hypothetical protein
LGSFGGAFLLFAASTLVMLAAAAAMKAPSIKAGPGPRPDPLAREAT